MTQFALLQITLSITVTSNAKRAQPAATSDGELSQREASDSGDNDDNGNNSDGCDYCSDGITNVLDVMNIKSCHAPMNEATLKIPLQSEENIYK